MNVLKGIVMGLVVVGFCVLSSASFATDEMNDKNKIQALTEAAAALQSSNPILAVELTKFVNEEAKEAANEMAGKKEEKKELEGANEADMKKHHIEHIKLLNDSAAALATAHPDLAKRLTAMAEHSEQRMKEKKEGKEDTKETEEKEMKGK